MLAIWDKPKPEMDLSILEWRPRITDQWNIENYQDPWICPSGTRPAADYVKPKDWKLGHARKVWVSSSNGPVEYDSVRKAFRVIAKRYSPETKRGMKALQAICNRLGLTCGYVNAED